MFSIAVRFVTGRYYAASHADRTRPEWPPHPDRLFSALVAACHQACEGTGRAALEWLERQGPPSLAIAPSSDTRTAGRTMLAMVRTNDADARGDGLRVLPDQRKPQPRWFPSTGVDDPVYFIWPHAQPDLDVARDLERLSQCMTYLGSSKSPVIAWVADTPPTPTLVPGESGTFSAEPVILRVPTAGRLAELEDQYAAGLRPRPGHQQPYLQIAGEDTETQQEIYPSAFGDMFIYARTGGPAPSLEAALTVTHALRRALLAVGDRTTPSDVAPPPLPEMLHGHGPAGSPHCAFVALPHVGAAHADGHLLGVAVLFPQTCDAEERQAVLRILSSLQFVHTPIGNITLAPTTRQPAEEQPWGLQLARWCGPATTWTSVTPVLFDRFPRPSRGGILGAVQALARHAGLPAPVDARTHQISPLTGVALARSYRVQRTQDDRPHYVAHLSVTFDRPVAGPILLGAGRFFGLGLCVPNGVEMGEDATLC